MVDVVEACFCYFLFPPPMAQQPIVSQGLLIIEASWSHSETRHSLGILWTSDQPDADTLFDNTYHFKKRTSMPSAGFEPAIPANEVANPRI